VIAVDTNVLVYAHRPEMPKHAAAAAAVRALGESGNPWAIPWPCAHEFLATVTNRRLFSPPTPAGDALAQLGIWAESPWFVFLPEAGDHLIHLADLLRASGVVGGAVHDARIAAICLGHDVTELWSADRDFRKFPGLRVVNPLVAK
jgi:toxin-antitoxin system PIN domain toxin